MKKKTTILGIETSCDETAVSIIQENGSDKPSSNQYTETNLYDLNADPYELNNLIGISTYDEITTSLRKKIKNKIQRVEDITSKITKANNINNPGQMGLNPDSFHRLKKKL